MTAAFLRSFMPYGAPDLQDAARPDMVRALALSSGIATVSFAVAWSVSVALLGYPAAHRPMGDSPERRMVEIGLPPPPPISVRLPDPVAPVRRESPVAAIPVPVPEEAAPDHTTVMNQSELVSDLGPGAIGGASLLPAPAAAADPVPTLGQYVYVDQLPAEVKVVEPVYPDLAKQAGVEGLVLVNVLVGKDGRVMDARVDAKNSVLLLDDAALDAARQWVFTPALANNHPVMTWVALRFRFTLHN
jgi:periplasmic protein TonB